MEHKLTFFKNIYIGDTLVIAVAACYISLVLSFSSFYIRFTQVITNFFSLNHTYSNLLASRDSRASHDPGSRLYADFQK